MKQNKKCSKCNIDKELTEFYERHSRCKSCVREIQKEYRENNKQAIRERHRIYHSANKEKRIAYNEANKKAQKEYRKEYYRVNQEAIKDKAKDYNSANRPKINEQRKNRRKTNEVYALSIRLRNRTRMAFSLGGYSKDTKTEEILGCSWATLKRHIENQFTEGMSWENPFTFHIDHVKPLGNAKTKEELIELFHYTNLQPLSPEINLMKSNLTPQEWELKKQTKEYQQLIITQ